MWLMSKHTGTGTYVAFVDLCFRKKLLISFDVVFEKTSGEKKNQKLNRWSKYTWLTLKPELLDL